MYDPIIGIIQLWLESVPLKTGHSRVEKTINKGSKSRFINNRKKIYISKKNIDKISGGNNNVCRTCC